METVEELKTIIDEKLRLANQVFIVPHNEADFDAIASAIGLYLITKKFGREAYIILDEDLINMEPGVKSIIEEITGVIPIISMEEYKELRSDNDLLFITDTCKDYRVCCKDYLDCFKDIIIIDHHDINDNVINTPYKFIKPEISSVSEVITELLSLYGIESSVFVANYLLAGIFLDTNNCTKNCKSNTMKMVQKLFDLGADTDKVNELFEEDFLSAKKVYEAVTRAKFYNYNVALSIAICIADENVIYTKEELAKVADELLKYKTDATFALGFINPSIISISARSKGKIDVSKLMNELGGGGNAYSAATKIESNKLEDVNEVLVKKLKPYFSDEEIFIS